MLMTSERRPAIRTMRGWAIDVLQNAGAIRECEEHGWMQDRVSTAVGIQATAAEQKQASSSSVEAAREARFSIAP